MFLFPRRPCIATGASFYPKTRAVFKAIILCISVLLWAYCTLPPSPALLILSSYSSSSRYAVSINPGTCSRYFLLILEKIVKLGPLFSSELCAAKYSRPPFYYADLINDKNVRSSICSSISPILGASFPAIA